MTEDEVLTPIVASRKRRRPPPPLESHPDSPKIWPPSAHIYPLVVQSILEQNVFGVDDQITQRLIELSKSADVIKVPKVQVPEIGGGALGFSDALQQQQSSSGETINNEDLSPSSNGGGGGGAPHNRASGASINASPPPVVQILADGALTSTFDDMAEETNFDIVVDRHNSQLLKGGGVENPAPQSTVDMSTRAKEEGCRNSGAAAVESMMMAACDSNEEFDLGETVTDFEVVRPTSIPHEDQEIEASKIWDDTIENWREFDETFDDGAFDVAPVRAVEPPSPNHRPREDALFWAQVSGGFDETMGVEDHYRQTAQASHVSKQEAFAVDSLGWEFRVRSVIPEANGVSRRELATVRYEDVVKAYQPQFEIVGLKPSKQQPAPSPPSQAAPGSPSAGEDEEMKRQQQLNRTPIPASSAYCLLGAPAEYPYGLRQEFLPAKDREMASLFLESTVANIERQVGSSESVRTTMAILRHMMTEPSDHPGSPPGGRVYDTSKILNPNPPILRSLVMDMNIFDVQPENKSANKVAALHVYQSLVPLVARYLSRPEPPTNVHRDGGGGGGMPPMKRLKRAPNEENLPIKHPESVNMLQICKFITEHSLRDYSLWQSWGEILSIENPASIDEAELWKHHQRWNSVYNVIHQLAGGMVDYTKANEIIIAWLRTHKAIADPLGHITETWSMKIKDAMKEIPLQWLTPTNDEVYLTMDPYKPVHKSGMGGGAAHRRDLAAAKVKALTHAPIAWSFPTAMPKMTSVNLIRHFRPDFRTGLFHARYFVQEGMPYVPLPAGRSAVHKTRIATALNKVKGEADGSGLGINLSGSSGLGGSGGVGGGGLGGSNTLDGENGLSPLWGSWRVQYPSESLCLTEYNIRLSGGDDSMMGDPSVGGVGGGGNNVHPADVLQTTESLSLGEWCPMVLLEHTLEPQILPLPGMVSKIIRFYRPGKELYASPAQAETKLAGRLGLFGSLRILGDRQPQLFGCPLRIKPNQGVSIIKTSVYAGICLVHPFDQRRPLPTPEEWLAAREKSERPLNSREGLSGLACQDIDFRLTDFILVRTGSYNNTNSKTRITLRPLFYGFGQSAVEPPTAAAAAAAQQQQSRHLGRPPNLPPQQQPPPQQHNSQPPPLSSQLLRELYGIREQVALAMDSYARTGIYSLGQLAPMTEIPTPDGKRINEWRKLWVEAYSLRQSSFLDTSDMLLNKNKCIKWFQGIFDTQILQKIILPLKNSLEENTTSISIEKYLQSNRVKIVSHEIIQKILTPEQICGIISSQYGLVKLVLAGIRYLRIYDRVAIARTIIQQRDFASDAQWARLYAMYIRWKNKGGTVVGDSDAGDGPSGGLGGGVLGTLSGSLFTLPPPYRGMCPSFRIQMSIVARMIEELIVFSPWSQWKCYQEISIKKNAQFLLGSVFDESFGRGENLCFLKEDINQQCIRDQIIPMITKYIPDSYRQLPITRFGIDPTRLVIFEDSKRGFIQEINTQTLQISLLRSGFSPNDVAVMSRPELINAVYRFNFAITPNRGHIMSGSSSGVNGMTSNASGRLDLGDYYSRVNDIINRHKNVLQNDTPSAGCAKDFTDVFEEAANPKLDHLDLELSLTEGLSSKIPQSNNLENELELELIRGQAGGDDNNAGKSSTGLMVGMGKNSGDHNAHDNKHKNQCALNDKTENVCTHEQLISNVWSLESVLAPESRLGAGPPMGLVTKEEGDKFEKELADRGEDQNLIFPPSNSVNGMAMSAWLKGLPEGEVKDILVAKQSTAVPCLRWIRRVPTVGIATGGRVMNKDKVVLIFGTENIQKFIAWRRRRLVAKFCKTAPAEASMTGASSSVTTKRHGGSALGAGGAPLPPAGRRGANRTDASIVRKMMTGPSAGVPAPRRAVPATAPAIPVASAATPIKSESAALSADDIAMDDSGPPIDESSIVAREVRGCLPVSSVRLTSRQQRLLQERIESGKGGPVNFTGTAAQAAEELNSNLSRLIGSLKKPEKKFVWFWDRVNEKDAPNYYNVVQTPMWLNCVHQKCTQKEYKSVQEFEDDIQLIHANCFAYNPDGHWIRPLAEQLVKAVQQKLRYQRAWLEEVQKAIPKS